MYVYLSGPMTGNEDYNFPEFFRIAAALREQGYDVFSPAEFDIEKGWVRSEYHNGGGYWWPCFTYVQEPPVCGLLDRYEHRFVTTDNFNYEEALRLDCEKVQECDGIVLMPGWQTSNGSLTELQTALAAGLTVFEWDDQLARPVACSNRWVRKEGGIPSPSPITVSYEVASEEIAGVLDAFVPLLLAVSGDGKKKRDAGLKPVWTEDDSHRGAMYRHLRKWEEGATKDEDSGQSHLVHLAWRALAVAAKEA